MHRDIRLTIRFTGEEWASLEKYAAGQGRTVSQEVRHRCFGSRRVNQAPRGAIGSYGFPATKSVRAAVAAKKAKK